MQRLKRHHILLFILAIIIIASVLEGASLSDASSLRSKISSYGIVARPVFVAFQIIQSISIWIPLTPLTVSGGLVFGVYQGFVLSWIGVYAGQIFLFYLGRRLRLDASSSSGHDKKEVVSSGVKLFSSLSLLVLYASGFFSFDLLSGALGLLLIPWLQFLVVAGIGIIPKLLLLSGLGEALNQDLIPKWLTIGFVLLIWCASGLGLYLFRGRFISLLRSIREKYKGIG